MRQKTRSTKTKHVLSMSCPEYFERCLPINAEAGVLILWST